VFDVLSHCKDKAAHLPHAAAAFTEKKKEEVYNTFLRPFIPVGTGHFNIL